MIPLTKNELKNFIRLHRKKERMELGLFLVQGKKLVKEALLHRKHEIQFIISTQNESYPEDLFKESSGKDLERLSTLKTAPDVIAVMHQFQMEYDESGWTLLLDNIKDPGNLGTLIRMADWFGFNSIICSLETVDVFNPKVVQASMGSVFRVPVTYQELGTYLKKQKRALFLADLEGESVYNTKFPREGILCLGSESHGVNELLLEKGTPIFIPGRGGAESLNVAMAGSVISGFISASISKLS